MIRYHFLIVRFLTTNRVLHPDLVYGALSSSGVIHATIELPEYMEVIRNAAPVDCSKGIESSIAVIDHILLHNTLLRKPLKALFGLADLEHEDDFVSLIAVSETHRLCKGIVDSPNSRVL